MKNLLSEIKRCKVCKDHLSHGVRPVVSVSKTAKILIISQAPGIHVHNSGIPFDDKSGERLREWMGIDSKAFYDNSKIAIMPMGFCYPGKGKSGDLPPRKECAPLWHENLLSQMPNIELILLIGQYSQKKYLGKQRHKNLTETVRNFEDFLPKYFVLPHPSPLNNIWLKKNPWFEKGVIPKLKRKIQALL